MIFNSYIHNGHRIEYGSGWDSRGTTFWARCGTIGEKGYIYEGGFKKQQSALNAVQRILDKKTTFEKDRTLG